MVVDKLGIYRAIVSELVRVDNNWKGFGTDKMATVKEHGNRATYTLVGGPILKLLLAGGMQFWGAEAAGFMRAIPVNGTPTLAFK